MLGPLCRLLGEKRVILASGSPRRKQILENIVCYLAGSLGTVIMGVINAGLSF